MSELAQALGTTPQDMHVSVAAVVAEYLGDWLAIVFEQQQHASAMQEDTSMSAPIKESTRRRSKKQQQPLQKRMRDESPPPPHHAGTTSASEMGHPPPSPLSTPLPCAASSASLPLADTVGLLYASSTKLHQCLEHFMNDLPGAMDRYVTEGMIHVLWVAASSQPMLRTRRYERLCGSRCSGESLILALAVVAIFERLRRDNLLYASLSSLEDALGSNAVDAATGGGGIVEYIELLLEREAGR